MSLCPKFVKSQKFKVRQTDYKALLSTLQEGGLKVTDGAPYFHYIKDWAGAPIFTVTFQGGRGREGPIFYDTCYRAKTYSKHRHRNAFVFLNKIKAPMIVFYSLHSLPIITYEFISACPLHVTTALLIYLARGRLSKTKRRYFFRLNHRSQYKGGLKNNVDNRTTLKNRTIMFTQCVLNV